VEREGKSDVSRPHLISPVCYLSKAVLPFIPPRPPRPPSPLPSQEIRKFGMPGCTPTLVIPFIPRAVLFIIPAFVRVRAARHPRRERSPSPSSPFGDPKSAMRLSRSPWLHRENALALRELRFKPTGRIGRQ